MPTVAVTVTGPRLTGTPVYVLMVWNTCVGSPCAGALMADRCAKPEAIKTAKSNIRARASVIWSAEARTELSYFFFIFVFRDDSGPRVEFSLFSGNGGPKFSEKKREPQPALPGLRGRRSTLNGQ